MFKIVVIRHIRFSCFENFHIRPSLYKILRKSDNLLPSFTKNNVFQYGVVRSPSCVAYLKIRILVKPFLPRDAMQSPRYIPMVSLR